MSIVLPAKELVVFIKHVNAKTSFFILTSEIMLTTI